MKTDRERNTIVEIGVGDARLIGGLRTDGEIILPAVAAPFHRVFGVELPGFVGVVGIADDRERAGAAGRPQVGVTL